MEDVIVTIIDVAQRAGVSVSTVSYAFTGKRPVGSETKARILRAARELGYCPTAVPAHKPSRCGMIAVSSPMDETTEYGNWSPFVFNVAKQLRIHGYDMVLLTGNDAVTDLIHVCDHSMVDGVLLLGVTVDDDRAFAAGALPAPVVSIGCARRMPRVSAIDLDFEQMGRMAVDVMLKAGHRHLLFVGADESAYEQGVNFLVRTRAAAMAYAKSHDVTVTSMTTAGRDMDAVRGIVDRAFSMDHDITGVLGQCGHGVMARLKRAIEERDLLVPGDVSLLELGSFGSGAEFDPPLDEIPLQPYAMCRHAVDTLMARIEHGSAETCDGIRLIPVSYIRRGSVVSAPM